MSYNKQLEDNIDHHFIDHEKMTKNKQMGGVGWLMNGNMCFGIYEDLLVIRIDPIYVKSLIKKPNIHLFGHREGDTDEFISITKEIYRHPKALAKFLDHALKQTSALPPKKRSDQAVSH